METDRIQGDGHYAQFPHLVAEAGSIVLHVSNNMNEVKKDDEDSEDGEEVGGTAAAKETEEISRKDAEIRRLIEFRRSIPKEEKQRTKELSKKHQKMYIVHISDTEEMTRIPEITSEELQVSIRKLIKK